MDELPFDLPVIEPEAPPSARTPRATASGSSVPRGACSTSAARAASRWTMSPRPPASARARSSAASAHAPRSRGRALRSDERGFQEAFIRGEPPLGPGAPPRERLIAFGEAMLDTLDAHAELLPPPRPDRRATPIPPTPCTACTSRCCCARPIPAATPSCWPRCLLAALSGADLFVYLRRRRRRDCPASQRLEGTARCAGSLVRRRSRAAGTPGQRRRAPTVVPSRRRPRRRRDPRPTARRASRARAPPPAPRSRPRAGRGRARGSSAAAASARAT